MTSPTGDQRILFTQKEVVTALKNEGFKQVISGESKFSIIANPLHKAGLAAKVDCQDNQSVYVLLPLGDQIKNAATNQGLASQDKKGLVAKIAIESILKHQKRALGADSYGEHHAPTSLTLDINAKDQIQTVENRTKLLKEAVDSLNTIFKNVFTSTNSIKGTSTLDQIENYLKSDSFKIEKASNYVQQEAKQIVEFLKTVTGDLKKECELVKQKFSNQQNYEDVIKKLDKKELPLLPEYIFSLKSTDINYSKFVGVVKDINEQSHENLKLLKQHLEKLKQAGDKRTEAFLNAGVTTRTSEQS
jgi:DNA-binding ferritin-like protein